MLGYGEGGDKRHKANRGSRSVFFDIELQVDNNEKMVCILNSANLILITLVVVVLSEIQIFFFS